MAKGSMTKSKEITYDIIQELGTVWESEDGTNKKELNLVSWNGGEAKLELRTWRYDKEGNRISCGKIYGMTLEEFEKCVELAEKSGLFGDEDDEYADEEEYDEDVEDEEE